MLLSVPLHPSYLWTDLLVRLVSVDLHTFGPEALTAVRLIEHQSVGSSQVAEVRPQLVEQVPSPMQGTPLPGEYNLVFQRRFLFVLL